MNSWTANHCESVVSGDLSFSVQSLDPVLQSFAAMGWREIAGAGLLLYGCFNAHLAATSILLGEILLEVFVESRLFPFVELHFTKYEDIVLVYFRDSDIRSGRVPISDLICLQCSQVSLCEVHTCLLLHILRGSDGWCSSCLCCFQSFSYLLCFSGSFCANFSVFTLKRALKASKAKRSRICSNGSWNTLGQVFWFLDWNHDSMDSNFETPVAVQELTNFEMGETIHVSIAIHVVCSNPNPYEARVQL